MRYANMATAFCEGNRRNFWTEVKKTKGGTGSLPSSVDGQQNDEAIAQVFCSKYERLFNSAASSEEEMRRIKERVRNLREWHRDCDEHAIRVADVVAMANKLKPDKHDGDKGHYSNHLRLASHRFMCCVSVLLNAMLIHGSVPRGFQLCTIIPIPKNKRKSVNDSENYRAIALHSILGKLLDKIILHKCQDIFRSSPYQFTVAQRIARWLSVQRVQGSNPSGGAHWIRISWA